MFDLLSKATGQTDPNGRDRDRPEGPVLGVEDVC